MGASPAHTGPPKNGYEEIQMEGKKLGHTSRRDGGGRGELRKVTGKVEGIQASVWKEGVMDGREWGRENLRRDHGFG